MEAIPADYVTLPEVVTARANITSAKIRALFVSVLIFSFSPRHAQ
jgi:hypothetical protein